jgi:deoxycytidylate deaminase
MTEQPQKKKAIEYPFMNPEGKIYYVAAENEHMQAAKEFAREKSLDKVMPTGTVLVKDGKVIGRGANGSDYHEKNGCERVRLNIPTGEGYELCEGCSPKNHSEPKAIADASEKGNKAEGAKAYLWGHWWCCESCWQAMIKNGITDVYLLEGSEELFNKLSPKNIVNKQFA